jgi:hypothetical protein
MSSAEALQFAMTALGACIAAIAWWIGSELKRLNDRIDLVLKQLCSHEVKITKLEEHNKLKKGVSHA